jgi:hypothetical protein
MPKKFATPACAAFTYDAFTYDAFNITYQKLESLAVIG